MMHTLLINQSMNRSQLSGGTACHGIKPLHITHGKQRSRCFSCSAVRRMKPDRCTIFDPKSPRGWICVLPAAACMKLVRWLLALGQL